MIVGHDHPSIHSLAQFDHIVQLSNSATPGVRAALFTGDQLVRHGCHERALRVIERVAAKGHRNETLNIRLGVLTRAAAQVRAVSGLDAMLANSRKFERLLSFRSSIFTPGASRGRIVVVYATAWNNFDISFPFLHCLISGKADRIIYVKNPERGMYATGNHDFGGSIDEMSANICDLIARMGPAKVTVMGFSGGGYAALHLAAMARADVFLGLGIRTDYSIDSPFAPVHGRTAPCAADYKTNTLVNMRYMPEVANIGRAMLYFGERDDSDRDHARNMAGLPNFSINAVRSGSHNLVMEFLADGILQEILASALD